ncbi:hypothetical protein V6N11_014424 [Hibiscus sabdariffa]|uniref:Uncharacterized protein n=2 Tax=Hibiscus sabdariffa TaxID=183260 RepID=A0ABR2ARH5_9ROSI
MNEDEHAFLQGQTRYCVDLSSIKTFKNPEGGGIEEGKMEGIVKEHLTGNDFAYIERMYEEYGSRIMDLLRHSPSLALPFIINRLTEQDTSPSCSPCDHLNLEYFNWHD